MSRTRQTRRAGAARRMEASPFGNSDIRQSWAGRIADLSRLDDAVSTLIALRERSANQALTDKDMLWVEARLEDRVAVLRFEELSNAVIRAATLTGEPIERVREEFARRAADADTAALEALAAEFRRRYKPPIMPSSPYLEIEALLCGHLMKKRSLNWFEPSITELRARRGARILKEGWPDTGTTVT
jgi:methane monooxygenase component A gamma chain